MGVEDVGEARQEDLLHVTRAEFFDAAKLTLVPFGNAFFCLLSRLVI